MGGAGEGVMHCLQSHGLSTPILCLGLPDHFIEHGTQDEMLMSAGLDSESIIRKIQKKLDATLENSSQIQYSPSHLLVTSKD